MIVVIVAGDQPQMMWIPTPNEMIGGTMVAVRRSAIKMEIATRNVAVMIADPSPENRIPESPILTDERMVIAAGIAMTAPEKTEVETTEAVDEIETIVGEMIVAAMSGVARTEVGDADAMTAIVMEKEEIERTVAVTATSVDADAPTATGIATNADADAPPETRSATIVAADVLMAIRTATIVAADVLMAIRTATTVGADVAEVGTTRVAAGTEIGTETEIAKPAKNANAGFMRISHPTCRSMIRTRQSSRG